MCGGINIILENGGVCIFLRVASYSGFDANASILCDIDELKSSCEHYDISRMNYFILNWSTESLKDNMLMKSSSKRSMLVWKKKKKNCKCPYIVPRPIWILVANLMHLLNTYQRLFFIFLFFLGKWKAKLLFWKVKIVCHAQLTFISWKAPITDVNLSPLVRSHQ